MKISNLNNEATSAGVLEEARATVADNDSKIFQILSSSLYSNKINAVVQEITCNALDSADVAGSSRPMTIKVPNALSLVWECRDYGTGLSHDDVMALYLGYFKSTKDQDNKSIGGYGLGSKSPFAYCNSFTVTSWFDGVQSIYAMTFDRATAPAVRLLHQEPTEEPNGLAVAVPVQKADIEAFSKATAEICGRYTPKPEIKGASAFNWPEVEYKESGTGWAYYKSSRYRGCVAMLGPVAYPINSDSLLDATEQQKRVLVDKFELYFDIGELDITPSREELQYTKKTCKAITDRLNTVYMEVINAISATVSAHATTYDAYMTYLKAVEGIYHGIGVYRRAWDTVKYKGVRLSERLSFSLANRDKDKLISECRYVFCSNWDGSSFQKRSLNSSITINPKNSIVVYDDEMDNRIAVRVKQNPAFTGKYAYIFRGDPKGYHVLKGILWDGTPIYRTRDLPPAPKKAKAKAKAGSRYKTPKLVKKVGIYGHWGSCSTPSNGGYFVDLHNYNVISPFHGGYVDKFGTLLSYLCDLGILQQDTDSIYGVLASYRGSLKHGQNGWKNIIAHAKDQITQQQVDILKHEVTQSLDEKATYDAISLFLTKLRPTNSREGSVLEAALPSLVSLYDVGTQLRQYTLSKEARIYRALCSAGIIKDDLKAYTPQKNETMIRTFEYYERNFPLLFESSLYFEDDSLRRYISDMKELNGYRQQHVKAAA